MAIAYVRQATNQVTSATTCAVTITAPTAGNALIATVCNSSADTPISSITGGGVTWALSKFQSDPGNSSVEIWYGLNSSGSGTSVTVTIGAKRGLSVNVSEYSGITATDLTAGAAGTSTTINAGSVSATLDDSLVISVGNNSTRGISPSAGPTNSFNALTYVDNASTDADLLAAYRITTASGSYSTAWTVSSVDWAAAIATFQGTAGGGPTGHPAMRRFGGVPGMRGGQFYKGGVAWG